MSQTNVYDFMEKYYPQFMTFDFILEGMQTKESTTRMNLQRLIDCGLVCKTYFKYAGKKKVMYKVVPMEEYSMTILTASNESAIRDTENNP